MEVDQGLRHPRAASHPWRWLLLLCVLAGPACIIEKPPPEEEDMRTTDIPTIPGYSESVTVVQMYPPAGAKNVPRNTRIWAEFDQYLDADELGIVSTLRITSGGVGAVNRVQYEMVDKRIVATLYDPLEANFQYSYIVNHVVIFSATGAPMLFPKVAAFTTGERFVDAPVEQNEPTWADVEPIIKEGCGCHTLETFPDPWFDIPALTYARIVGQPSNQEPDIDIVEPYKPWQSYLMFKALPDYPDRRGTAMPPRWADQTELPPEVHWRALTLDELRLIEDWIQAGALP